MLAAQPTLPLTRLVYVSMLSGGVTSADVDAIVAQSRRANEARGITGMLAVDDGRICQILEGPSEAVGGLFETIQRDARHFDIIDLVSTPIDARHFGEWGMARRRMVDVVALAFTL